MKPRIKRTDGIWRCWTPGSGAPTGLGLTPRDAYWNHQGRTFVVAPQPPAYPFMHPFVTGDAPDWLRYGPTCVAAH